MWTIETKVVSQHTYPRTHTCTRTYTHTRTYTRYNMPKNRESTTDERVKILMLVQEGKSYEEVAKEMGVSKSGVGNIVKRWREKGTVLNQPRSGAPQKISTDTLVQLYEENPFATVGEILEHPLVNHKIHEKTVGKKVRNVGY